MLLRRQNFPFFRLFERRANSAQNIQIIETNKSPNMRIYSILGQKKATMKYEILEKMSRKKALF